MATKNLNDSDLEKLLTQVSSSGVEGISDSQAAFVRVLAAVDRQLLRETLVEKRFQKGDIIFNEGDPGDALYLIWSGRLAVVQGSLERPDLLRYRGPGEVVGEMALLNDKPRSATLLAVDDVRLLEIDRAGFETLLAREPAIGINIMAQLSERLRDSQNFFTNNKHGDHDLQQRVTSLRHEKENLLQLQQNFMETNELIVHDLRNPLGNIYSALNMLELVLPEEILADNNELLEIAQLSLMRMQRLVDSLLDISRLENRTITPTFQPVNLIDLIEDAIKANHFPLAELKLTVETEYPEESLLVWLDEALISRVLINLVENGIKYTVGREPLRISVEKTAGQVQIAVEDHGRGIPKENRRYVFERFVQGLEHGRRPPGYGLGLAFCRLAVEAHRGKIWIEDAISGPGSRFTFTLPLSNQNGNADR